MRLQLQRVAVEKYIELLDNREKEIFGRKTMTQRGRINIAKKNFVPDDSQSDRNKIFKEALINNRSIGIFNLDYENKKVLLTPEKIKSIYKRSVLNHDDFDEFVTDFRIALINAI